MAQHTPGPWMQHDMEFATVVTERKPGQFIAFCNSAADARLIAAAPDLFEALKIAEQRLRGAGMIGGINNDPVCAALVKATQAD